MSDRSEVWMFVRPVCCCFLRCNLPKLLSLGSELAQELVVILLSTRYTLFWMLIWLVVLLFIYLWLLRYPKFAKNVSYGCRTNDQLVPFYCVPLWFSICDMCLSHCKEKSKSFVCSHSMKFLGQLGEGSTKLIFLYSMKLWLNKMSCAFLGFNVIISTLSPGW